MGAAEAGPDRSPASLPGWEPPGKGVRGFRNDPAAFWPVFHASCVAIVNRKAPLRQGTAQGDALRAVCTKAATLEATLSDQAVRAFLEAHFDAVKLSGNKDGFMTAYYEPDFEAARTKSAAFPVPVLKAPHNLATVKDPDRMGGLTSARRLGDGRLAPLPDRAAIEAGALAPEGLEIFWMRDAFELFTMQVQGSGRLRLTDGTATRLMYDGRNGYPYTSIGKVLIERGLMTKDTASMARIGALFKDKPALAREVMHHNKSYVFFRERDRTDTALGPIGAQGLPLTPLLSLAVDRRHHAYGLPFYVDGELPCQNQKQPLQRLMVAQDTGTAIVGAARIDLFAGWGKAAECMAGQVKEKIDLYVLRPKP